MMTDPGFEKPLAEMLNELANNDTEMEPFDGVFHVEGEDEPIIISPECTIEDLIAVVKQTQDRQKRLAQLSDWVDQFTHGDSELAKELLERELKRQNNKEKLKTICPLFIEKDNIYIELADKSRQKISFGRGHVAKALYIFYLQQIERAARDRNVSPYLSQAELSTHEKELLYIYQNLSGKTPHNLESLFQKSTVSNDFSNAISSIRNQFNRIFDSTALKFHYKKCYYIDNKGKDVNGNPRYGIGLDIDDFDLGGYSIDKMRF